MRRTSAGFIARIKRTCLSLAEPAAVCAAVTGVHLFFINSFGATWDEPIHRNWGKLFEAYRQTGDFAFVESMPGLGKYYGPLYHWFNYRLSEILYNAVGMQFVAANHVLTLLTFGICCSVLFALARSMFSRRMAWISVPLFALIPHLTAHAHYNPKDVPLMTVLALVLLAGYRALTVRSRLSAVTAGLYFGAALAIKLSAVMALPALGVAYLWTLGVSPGRRRGRALLIDAQMACLFAFASFAAVYLLWPSLWADIRLLPEGFLQFAGGYWPGKVLYFGAEYPGHGLPWHYTVFWYAASLPLPTILFVIAGCAVAVRGIRRGSKSTEYVLLLAWVLLPLVISLKPGLDRYDGERQFFFTLPALAVLAAAGLERCASFLGRRIGAMQRHGVTVLSVVTALWILVELWQVHPYEGAYLTPPARRVLGPHIERTLELEYWGSSYKEGMEWLVANAKPDPVICVPVADILTDWYPRRADFRFGCGENATYLMYFSRYSFNREDTFGGREAVFEVERYGSRLMAIFELR